MSERWPDVAGRMEGGAHVLPVRIYYEDTDGQGFVYHANYLRYCERGRTDFLRVNGITQSSFIDANFVVRRMVCDFLKPARLDDLLEVETRVAEAAGARLELDQAVRCGSEAVFTARVTVVLIDGRGRPRRLPPDILAAMKSRSESDS
jgi:acyl-CoA thioester hydrolase